MTSHRPLIDDSKFDVNVTYAAAMTLQDWADPLVDFQKRALDAVKWKHTPTTLVWVAACSPVCYLRKAPSRSL